MILGDGAKCAELSPEERDATFDFEGPHKLSNPPGAPALRAWEAAQEICIECPLYLSCRESNWGQEYGIWGGTTQHERWNYRRRLARQLASASPVERARLAARLHARYAGGAGQSYATIARRTGYSESTVQALVREHRELLAAMRPHREERVQGRLTADEKERLRSMALKGTAMRSMQTVLGRSRALLVEELAAMDLADAAEPEWPLPPPQNGDGWVRHHGIVRAATYVAQTSDGRWFYMAIRGQTKLPTRVWFAANCVSLRRRPPVQIKERRSANAA